VRPDPADYLAAHPGLPSRGLSGSSPPEPPQPERGLPEASVPERTLPEASVPERGLPDSSLPEPPQPGPAPSDPPAPEPVQPEPVQPEPVQPEPPRPEPPRPEPPRPEPPPPGPDPAFQEPTLPEPDLPERSLLAAAGSGPLGSEQRTPSEAVLPHSAHSWPPQPLPAEDQWAAQPTAPSRATGPGRDQARPAQQVPAQRESASQEMPRLDATQPASARHEPAHAGRRPRTAENGSRASRRQRVSTRDVFCELADLAGIPRAAYALEAEVDGVLCLLPAAAGYDVFVSADGARHEVRSFPDEEAAYFYLFGVLVAEAVRNGALTPAATHDSPV
jgi:hypothetical protein